MGTRNILEHLTNNGFGTPEIAPTGDALQKLIQCTEKTNLLLRALLSSEVETLDTTVFEHASTVVPAAAFTGSLVVPAQTRQMERIEGFATWFTTPYGITYTLAGVTIKIGPFVMNTFGGAIDLKWLLNAGETRSVTINSDNNVNVTPFGAAVTLNMVLWGRTIPATLGEVQT